MNEEIKIGTKTTSEYVLAGLNQIDKGAKKLTILARGKQITKAIDVCEIIKAQKETVETKTDSCTESFMSNEKKVKISAIKIVMSF